MKLITHIAIISFFAINIIASSCIGMNKQTVENQSNKSYGEHTATLLGIEKVLDNKQLLICLQDKGFSVVQPFRSFLSEDIIDFIKTSLKLISLDGKKINQKFKKFAHNLNQQNANSGFFAHLLAQKQPPLINEINTFISEATIDGDATIVVSLANESNQQIITQPTVKKVLLAIGICIATYLNTESTYKVFIPVLLQAKPSRQDKLDTHAQYAIELTSRYINKFFGKPINFDVAYNQSTKTINIIHTKQHTPVTIKNQEFIEKIKKPDDKITLISSPNIEAPRFQNAKNEYTKNYSIHVMWINRYCHNFLAVDKEKTDKLISCALGWAEKNPDAKIFIWYDSNFITKPEAAIQYIKDSINTKQDKIIFKDIKELETVKKHVSVFSDKLPVYFRVDLLREIIAYEMLTNDETSCFVYADIDVNPISKDALFDPKTIALLKKYGIIVPKMQGASSIKPYENGFQMVTCNNTALAGIKTILVDVNIAVAESFLNPSTPEQQETKRLFKEMYSTKLQQHVYETFLVMFKFLHFLNGVAISKSEINITSITQEAINNYWDGIVTNTLYDISPKIGHSWFFPLKEINIPSPQINYY